MPLFSRFKNKGTQPAAKSKAQPDLPNGKPAAPQKPKWESSWSSKTVELDEVEELIHLCTAEMKSRAEALDSPFLLLPFRPHSDPSPARSFIRNFYKANAEGSGDYRGSQLQQELRLTEPIVLCSIIKWCWSRMPEGVVTWPVYEGFQIGEQESHMARNAFHTFIPLSAESSARKNIIFDFFDLLAAVAAHGKMNGLGGRKLSRLAGWWAFEHSDDGKGFEGGYRSWETAADASSHLFFAYLRSLSPEADPSMSVIERIPRSLQALLASTEYPPETPTLMQRSTPRVVMIVDSVSPTPFALLRRAKHFEYRDNDRVLREYSEFDDPLDALTDENKRVLYAISSTNSAAALSRHGNLTKSGQETWSSFQNLGFSDLDVTTKSALGANGTARTGQGLRAQPRSRNNDGARPTTPSWADFLSSGFAEDDAGTPTTLRLPSDKVLPPIGSRTQTPQPMSGEDDNLAPGELAAVTNVELDDAFWWVWMTSLAGEEPAERKAVFGRCALVETSIMNGRWLIMEEQVKGASPDPTDGAYLVPKKSSLFSFTKRGKNKRAKSEKEMPAPEPYERVTSATPSKTSLAPDQQSKIKAAAAALARQQSENDTDSVQRRGRHEDAASLKTSSMLTMGMMSEASPAMKWASAYDKKAIRAQYLGDNFAGRGMSRDNSISKRTSSVFMNGDASSSTAPPPALSSGATVFPADQREERELPALPKETQAPTIEEKQVLEEPAPPAQEPELPAQMPPSAPAVNVLPSHAEETQQVAEEVPLPEPTPAQPANAFNKEVGVEELSPSRQGRVERKPVPRVDNMQEHPAFRQQKAFETPGEPAPAPAVPAEPQTPTSPRDTRNAAQIAAQHAMEARAPSSSPESLQKVPALPAQGKLKKQAGGGGGGGLKKFFGRKKDNPNRQSIEVSANSLAPPSESTLGRRRSWRGNKAAQRQPPEHEHPPLPTQMQSEPTLEESTPAPPPAYEEASAEAPHAMSREPDAEQDFSRFDQGPIEDMPAAEPQESREAPPIPSQPAPQPQRQWNTSAAARLAPPQPQRRETEQDDFVTPMERGDPTNDAESEKTMEDTPQEKDIAPTQDRWAMIRENAARRAARASEEQSTQSRPSQSKSTRETDDGETSGEETIESRVARIKARVAELTGGIDGNAPAGYQRR